MKMRKTKINKRTTSPIARQCGFTLVETMFAVMILTFTIVGMMTVVANSLFAARYARDEITANYLLQEVVDYIRNDRDTTVFLESGNTWDDFFAKYSNCGDQSSGCYFDVLSDSAINPTTCSLGGCPNLYYDPNAYSTPFYVSDDGINTGKTKTNFKRKIVVLQNGTDEIDVTITIEWLNGNLPISRSLKTSFMKWQ
jgi:type II secretory pathway pseudopilin PulG